MSHVKKFNKWLNESGYWNDIESEGEPGWEEHREKAMNASKPKPRAGYWRDIESEGEPGWDVPQMNKSKIMPSIEELEKKIYLVVKRFPSLITPSFIQRLREMYGQEAEALITKLEEM
jgi:hypothetical protein